MNPRMPHEGDPHARTWMAWPTRGYTLGDSPEEAEEARRAWAAVAHAVMRFEPLTMVVDPAEEQIARDHLGFEAELMLAPLDDAWMRDIGPTFVWQGDELAAVDWVFNGWGGQDWAQWGRDQHIARTVAQFAGVGIIDSPLVNEGGGVHVDGEGTVLATESVQLDPGRNPGMTKDDVEREFARTIGATKTIWLPRGLTRDSERFGTRGHVDIVATFSKPGSVLVHDQRNPSHPDHAISSAVMELLGSSTDAAGRTLDVVRLPAPVTLRDEEGWVDYSYVNHHLVNGGVIACAFEDDNDDRAAGILKDAYPGREVVPVDARPFFARGGGIHCITQQEPLVGSIPVR